MPDRHPTFARVLIVEADRTVARELQAELAALGYDASAVAASADEAVAAASARCPDLVLVDIELADAAALLRARFDVALVCLAADADPATLARARRADPHGYVITPARAAPLRGAIEIALHAHARERQARAGARWLGDPRDPAAVARRLEMTDRLASLGLLAAGVAHEINNPLSVVIANATYVADELARVRDELGDDADVAEAITAQGELLAAADRVARIVADLRDFARPPADGEPRTDVAVAIARAVRTTAAQLRDRARVITEVAGDLPVVGGDEARVAQVVVNALIHAAQAIAPGDAKRQTVTVRARPGAAGDVELEIEDSGRGLAPAELERIFEPFYTPRAVRLGTGLGLAVSQDIVRSLGGAIRATSAPGQGATIHVRLPPAGASPPPPAPPPGRRARVLVIDDDDVVLRALGRMLRDHEVVTARGAGEALAILGRDPPFDVIFTDITMPEMTGVELFEHLQRARPADARRLVFVTGGALTADARDFLDTVANPHVEKPVRAAQLDAVIAQVRATTSLPA